jgi:predicted HD phosphohydrolase
MTTIKDTTYKILALYEKWGASDYIGESITQAEHALQCAYMATNDSRIREYDDFTWKCVVVAALLHDIGHLVGLENGEMEMRDNCASLGIVGHEGIGAAFLKECGMPSLVCDLVASHVASKRYLCTVREGYYEKLSDASKATMALQGGKMSYQEIADFRASRMYNLKIYIREYDDTGKNTEIDKNIDKKIENESSKMESSKMESLYSGMIESVLLGGRFFV